MPLGRRMGRPGLLGTVVRTAAIAGTAQAVGGRVHQRQMERQGQPAGGDAPPPPPPPPPATPASPPPGPADEVDETINQLKELAALRDQGVLTEDELAAQKAKILGS